MLRNVIVGLTASLLAGMAFIPDDALALRYSGAGGYRVGGGGVRGGAVAARGYAGRGYRGVGAYGGRYAGRYHPVARGAAVAAGTAAVAATGYYGGGWGTPGVGAQPWGYDVYGPGGYYGRPVARAAAVAAGTAPVAATGWGWNQPYGGGYGWGGGWGNSYGAYAASQPYDASVYGNGTYDVAPGTCYVDCDNYRKALIESGYDPKNYYTSGGVMKQTGY